LSSHWPDVADSPELEAASGLLRSVLVERYFEWLMAWLEVRDAEPAEWQEAAHLGDTFLYVTPEELDPSGAAPARCASGCLPPLGVPGSAASR
jgi:hypothetical protein